MGDMLRIRCITYSDKKTYGFHGTCGRVDLVRVTRFWSH